FGEPRLVELELHARSAVAAKRPDLTRDADRLPLAAEVLVRQLRAADKLLARAVPGADRHLAGPLLGQLPGEVDRVELLALGLRRGDRLEVAELVQGPEVLADLLRVVERARRLGQLAADDVLLRLVRAL